MDYAMAMNYINEKNKLGSVPGLVNVKELLRRLDNPQNKLKCLQIAGTNGKGSVFAFVQEVLLAAGYRIGRYISPTIFDYRERFQINKEYIPEDKFTEILAKVSVIVEEMEREGIYAPTAFEIETAIAFRYFYEEKVDFALIECGMGGLSDATNVIDTPFLTVFSSVGMDHMSFLGNSVSEIAKNKAGIIKHSGVCVSYPQRNEVKKELNSVCKEKNAEIYYVDEDEIYIDNMDINGSKFSYGNCQYEISLLGEHQIYNAVTAIKIFDIIKEKRGLNIKKDYVTEGLRMTSWPGRMTKVSDNPLTFVDGAHNQDGWLSLKNSVNKYFTNKKIIYIMGVLKDKEYTHMVDILKDTMNSVIAITPDNPRGLSKEKLAEIIAGCKIPVFCAESADEALRLARDKSDSDSVIMISGSLSFIREYL